MRGLWVTLVASGCTFSGATGSGDPPRPVDAQVVDTPSIDAPDAPPDAPGDTDGDMVLDFEDNCPSIANPEQWNEDGDMHGGDACDLCPHLAAAQLDGDGDKIGDDCDPRPGTTDELVLFDGFNTPSSGVPTGWTTSGGGTWSVASGRLRHVGTNNNAGIAVWPLPANTTAHSVDTSGTIVSVLQAGTTVFGALVDIAPTPGRFFQCAVREDNPQAELFHYFTPTNTWTPIQQVASTVTVGQSYRLIARAKSDDQDCLAAGQTLDGSDPTYAGTQIGFRVREMTADIAYLAVYRSP
jgi:hypothetical protein